MSNKGNRDMVVLVIACAVLTTLLWQESGLSHGDSILRAMVPLVVGVIFIVVRETRLCQGEILRLLQMHPELSEAQIMRAMPFGASFVRYDLYTLEVSGCVVASGRSYRITAKGHKAMRFTLGT